MSRRTDPARAGMIARGTTAALVAVVAMISTLVGACGSGQRGAASEVQELRAPAEPVVLTEVFETPRDTIDNVDSPAVWHGPAGQHWIVATAKETDVIVVADAETGRIIRRVGSEGTGPGQFDRPNGIAVVDDMMWVVERNNARVQVLSLPDFTPLGTFGNAELRYPYGIAIVPLGASEYMTYITDNYEFEDDVIPADSLLGERVRAYRVAVSGNGLTASLTNTIGDTTGDGVLRVVESIAVDPVTGRLLIAEEQEGASMIKVYDVNGRFTGRIIGPEFFPNQAEGIILYSCANGGGYWVATDQGKIVNTFHVFDRGTLEHSGSFRGRTVLNTDGIALTQSAFGPFNAGAFFAVHDDGSIAAFQWSDIAQALGLRTDCGAVDQ